VLGKRGQRGGLAAAGTARQHHRVHLAVCARPEMSTMMKKLKMMKKKMVMVMQLMKLMVTTTTMTMK
jgi:hypothetical protein